MDSSTATTSNESKQVMKRTLLQDGEHVWPYMNNLYSFFGRRSRKITVYSYGFDNGVWEAEISEMTGAKVQIFDSRPESKERFDSVLRIITAHKKLDTDPEWASFFEKKWIQASNLLYSTELPWTHNGSLETDFGTFKLKKTTVEEVPQLDIVKISLNTLGYDVVHSFLNQGYRPGLVIVRWDEHPDKNSLAMITAGHLQCCGYKLIDSYENSFIYMYTDSCLYECCSWERSDVENPLLDEIKQSLLPLLGKKTENQIPKVEETPNGVTSSPPVEASGQEKQTS
jgi:hypothetical protein